MKKCPVIMKLRNISAVIPNIVLSERATFYSPSLFIFDKLTSPITTPIMKIVGNSRSNATNPGVPRMFWFGLFNPVSVNQNAPLILTPLPPQLVQNALCARYGGVPISLLQLACIGPHVSPVPRTMLKAWFTLTDEAEAAIELFSVWLTA
jgi:hypothetical protein